MNKAIETHPTILEKSLPICAGSLTPLNSKSAEPLPKRKRSRFPSRPYIRWMTPEWVERFKQMLLEGNSRGAIAAILSKELGEKITRNMIVSICHRAGLRQSDLGLAAPKVRVAANSEPRSPALEEPRRRLAFARLEAVALHEPKEVDLSGVPLLKLKPNACRYETSGSHIRSNFRFCGEPVKEGSSFCAHHHRICYTPPAARKLPANSKGRLYSTATR